MDDPDLKTLTTAGWAKFMLRLSSEQLNHQLPLWNEVARSVALFEDITHTASLEILGDNTWADELFGCTIAEYVGAGMLLHILALQDNGRIDLDRLELPEMRQVAAKIPAAMIRRTATEHLIASPDQFRALQPATDASRHPDTRRYQFNPLHARPILSGLQPELLLPVPGLLVQKISPLGIFHTAVERFGDGFARDVGQLFEAYVGRQLQLLRGATVHPAITYHRDRRQRCESVDWIVVFDNVILLVEVKSTRPTQAIRAGDAAAAAALQKRLAKAFRQINTTAEQIRGRHQAFASIPHDRPIVGLVVTLEPFHVINSWPFRQWLPASPDPVYVCAAFELELLVTIEGRTAGDVLNELVNDGQRDGWNVGLGVQRASGVTFSTNPILDSAWSRLAEPPPHTVR
jgi:Holliday junction resolvase-like predicted endonuclease